MIVIQKIVSLDRDAVARCGIDAVLYLFLLRNIHPSFRDLYASIQQDSSFYQLLLQTVPNSNYFLFSSDNEIYQNLLSFYSLMQDGKNRSGSQALQNALHNLLIFRSSNIIPYTAVFSILRLCLLFHPTEQINDVVYDYCFKYAHSINLTNSPFRMLTNKDSLFFFSLSYL